MLGLWRKHSTSRRDISQQDENENMDAVQWCMCCLRSQLTPAHCYAATTGMEALITTKTHVLPPPQQNSNRQHSTRRALRLLTGKGKAVPIQTCAMKALRSYSEWGAAPSPIITEFSKSREGKRMRICS